LAGFDINVNEWIATYEAGVSVWDPANYIPWLASALWVHAAQPITCFQVEQMRLAAGIGEQQINDFLNNANFSIRSTRLGVVWLQNGFIYLQKVMTNIANLVRTSLNGWGLWYGNLQRTVIPMQKTNLDTMLDWLAYYISTPANVFIDIWNKSLVLYLSIGAGTNEQIDQLPGGGLSFFTGMVDFMWNAISFIWWVFSWIWSTIFTLSSIPIQFFQSLSAGLSRAAFSSLVSCESENFWCVFLAGVQLVNQSAGDTIFYPATIVLIILCTIIIFWKHIWTLVSLEVR